MLIGPLSAQNVCMGGVTIHRRKISVLNLAVDLHCRIAACHLQSTCFGDAGYLERLETALGKIAPHLWDVFIIGINGFQISLELE